MNFKFAIGIITIQFRSRNICEVTQKFVLPFYPIYNAKSKRNGMLFNTDISCRFGRKQDSVDNKPVCAPFCQNDVNKNAFISVSNHSISKLGNQCICRMSHSYI